MSELKRTVLHDLHVQLGATMVDFGGWDMPVQYPSGIVEEHLYTRSFCSLFDVTHMGRVTVSGPDQLKFLQHVLSSNAGALELNHAQYCIIPNEDGGAVDDAYLYRFEEDHYFLVINAANTAKDLAYLEGVAKKFDVTIENISASTASIAVAGPKSQELLTQLLGAEPTELTIHNSLGIHEADGRPVRVARTGYTGEPIGYELFLRVEDAVHFWNRLTEMGARPAGLGARDTLRLEACLPLYGHEMGINKYGDDIQIFSVPLARFAVSFAEGKEDMVGHAHLVKQSAAYHEILDKDFTHTGDLPYRIRPIALLGRGVLRAGCPVFSGEEEVGYVTSGTMVPYFAENGEKCRRSIGMAFVRSDMQNGDHVQIDVRGKRLDAVIVPYHMRANTPPYVKPFDWTKTPVK